MYFDMIGSRNGTCINSFFYFSRFYINICAVNNCLLLLLLMEVVVVVVAVFFRCVFDIKIAPVSTFSIVAVWLIKSSTCTFNISDS